jgi:hypothetical protein
MQRRDIVEDGQEARATSWARSIWALRAAQADDQVLRIVVHEATWYVPLRDKQPSFDRLRFWSEDALREGKDLRREHVITRKVAERRIADSKTEEEIRRVLGSLVVCVVTDEEHERLRPFAHIEGWDRYREGAAGLRVQDRKLEKPAF